MRRTETRDIQGNEYQVTTFQPRTALNKFFFMVKLLGPGIADAVSGAKNLSDVLDTDVDLPMLVKGLVERMDEEVVTDFIISMFSTTARNRRDLSDESNFNDAFSGNYGEMLEALAFVVEVNFSSFFAGKTADT